MANTFKIDTKSSVVTDAVSSSNATVVTAGGSATLVLLSCLVSNKTGASAQVDVYLVTNTGLLDFMDSLQWNFRISFFSEYIIFNEYLLFFPLGL